MAELPRVPFPDTTTQPVRTAISPSEVASPYQELARGLDRAGEKLSEVSVPLAERAADQAVQTDDAGNLVISKAPLLVGDAATAYARRTRMIYAARMEPQIETGMLGLRLQHPNDPEAFKTAAGDYANGVLGKVDDPALKASIGTMLSTSAAHNYRTSMTETNSQSVAEHLQSAQARIKDINAKGALLARQSGTDTPEYQALARSRAALYNELGSDPQIKFSPERAAQEIKANRDEDIGQAVIGQAQRIYQNKGNTAEAQKFLHEAMWGDKAPPNLTPAQREHYISEGIHSLENLSAQDRQAIAENRQAVNGYISTIRKDPSLFNDQQHNDLVARAESIGDYKSQADLREARVWQPVWADFKKMSPADQATNLSKLSQGVIPDVESASFLRSRAIGGGVHVEGVSPMFATRLQTALQDAEKATGETARIESMKRTTAEQAQIYARSGQGRLFQAAPPGYSRHEIGEAADIPSGKVLDWLHQNAGKYGLEFLSGNAGARDPGHVQMVKGDNFNLLPSAPQRIDLGADSPTSRLWQSTMADWRATVGKQANVAFAGLEAKAKTRDTFAPGEVDNFVNMAAMSGQPELIEKARPLIAAQEAEGKIPPGEAAAVISQAEAARAAGVDPLTHSVLSRIIEDTKAGEKAIRDEPLTESSRRGWSPPINPLNPENPSAFAQEVQQRQKSALQLQQHYPGYGPVPLIGKDEAVGLAAKLTSGDPAQAVQSLTALRTLPDTTYVATMAQPVMKEAVLNMSRSNDPTRFAAGNTTLATLWKAHPAEFVPIYGESALHRVLAYQALQGTLSAPEVMQRMNAADDPATAKARTDMGEAVDKEATKWTPNDVAYQLGSSLGIPIVSWLVNPITGATPAASTDEIAAGAMKNEFFQTYKSLRMYGVPQDQATAKAVEGMKAEWQVSQVAGGNTLMKHAPETYYPAIGGNHDWMKTDLQDHIESIMGPQITPVQGTESTFKSNWALSGLVSDEKTARDVKTGAPPSYRIAITDDRGQLQFLTDPKTGSQRFAWDAKAPLAAYTEKQKGVFEGRRNMIQQVAPYQGITGPM